VIIVGVSATGTALEKVDLTLPAAGSYWVAVQNWAASEEGAADAYTLATAVVDGELAENLAVEADAAIEALTEFDLTVKWSLDGGMTGDMYYGAVDLGASAESAGNLGLVTVDVVRGIDDVSISSNANAYMERQDRVDYAVTVLPKTTPGDRTYTVKATVPAGMTLDEESVTGDAVIDGNDITWTVVQESLFGAAPFYTMTSNANDATCAMPNFGQTVPGGYINLADLGVGIGEIEGNNQVGTYNISTNFLGKSFSSFNVTDDGFIFFSGEAGSTPWVNQLLPDSAEANDLIAPLWRDGHTVIGPDSGISVASSSAWAIVEYDNAMHFLGVNGLAANDIAPGDIADVMDFQVVIERATGNFMFAYNDVTHDWGSDLGATVGYENSTGDSGLTTIYAESIWQGGADGSVGTVESIESGLVLCYTLTSPTVEPTVFNFSAEISDNFAGGPTTVVLTHSTDDMNTEEVVNNTSVVIQVEGAPTAMITGSTSVTEKSNAQLSAASSSDPNGDELSYTWVQLSGTPVTFSANSETISFEAPKVAKDETISFQLTVDDGNGNSDTAVASVSIVNEKESGSFGWLMLCNQSITGHTKPLSYSHIFKLINPASTS